MVLESRLYWEKHENEKDLNYVIYLFQTKNSTRKKYILHHIGKGQTNYEIRIHQITMLKAVNAIVY